jgi:hypothetical protein
VNNRPTRVAVKLAISQAIHNHTIEQIGQDASKLQMFPIEAFRTLEAAIDKAYEEAEDTFNKMTEGAYE